MACLSSVLFGFTSAGLTVGESALLLRYSRGEEREKNLGFFRAATGLGGLISPILGSFLFAFGGFLLIFLVNGLGCFFIAPLVYCRMKASSVEFLKLRRDEEDEIALLNNDPIDETPKQVDTFKLLSETTYFFCVLSVAVFSAAFYY